MSSDRGYMVFTAVGPDRPGLVNEISSAIHAGGANLEDSRMAILGGEFALILLLSGTPDALGRVKEAGAELEGRLGLRCLLKDTTTPSGLGDHLFYRLRLTGVDRPGIVQAIASLVASRGINFASLESRVTYAPLSGTPMFVLEAGLQVPSRLDLAALRAEIARRCEEENLDFTLESRP
jgi:glycine cleavage system transcriptional repressor